MFFVPRSRGYRTFDSSAASPPYVDWDQTPLASRVGEDAPPPRFPGHGAASSAGAEDAEMSIPGEARAWWHERRGQFFLGVRSGAVNQEVEARTTGHRRNTARVAYDVHHMAERGRMPNLREFCLSLDRTVGSAMRAPLVAVVCAIAHAIERLFATPTTRPVLPEKSVITLRSQVRSTVCSPGRDAAIVAIRFSEQNRE